MCPAALRGDSPDLWLASQRQTNVGVRAQNAETVLGRADLQHVSCVNVTNPRFSDTGLVFPSVMMVLFLRHTSSVSSIPISFSTCNGFSNIANMISPWEKKMFLPRLKATAAALPVFSHGTMQLMNLEVNYIFSPVNALASFLHVFLKL